MLTPNVDWLRKIRAEFGRATPSPASYPSIFVSILDALLSSAPPDGAAEREANDLECGRCDGDGFEPSTHSRNACSLCGGSGRLPTPAPTEAPAAGDGEAAIATRMALCREFVAQQSASSEWKDGAATGFYAGWNAALAARPAAVTEAMVEAACLAQHGADAWPRLLATEPPIARAERKAAHDMLTAALAARGPA